MTYPHEENYENHEAKAHNAWRFDAGGDLKGLICGIGLETEQKAKQAVVDQYPIYKIRPEDVAVRRAGAETAEA